MTLKSSVMWKQSRLMLTKVSSHHQRSVKVCALPVVLFPLGPGLVSHVCVDPKGPTHCCINHRQGWERGNKNPRLGLNPAITQHARRDVWLDSLNYSHQRSLSAPSTDRSLSSSECTAISFIYGTLSSTILYTSRLKCYCVIKTEIPLAAQLHTSLLWSLSNGKKSPEECRVRLRGANSPHTGLVR